MTESHDHQPSDIQPDRDVSLFDWEVSVARARERADALRTTVNVHAATEAEASQAAYNELALSFEELNVAQEELRTLNDQVAESWDRADQERHRYHELFLAAPVPYLVTDRHGAIREANHAASQLLRVSRDRLHGKPVTVFVHDVSRRRLRRAILERSASPGASSVRFSITPRQSPPVFAEATLSSVADVDGAVREIRWLVVDRTRAALEQAQRLKDRLVATVSHEFRTGLAAIGGYAELLELGIHGPLTEVQMADIRRIRSAYEHLGLVVDDLLSYSKLVAGKLSVELAEVELGESIRALAELLAPQSSDRNIVVHLDSPGEEILVRADGERLRQILLNVTGNAIKFSPRDSRIVIRWQHDADTALVEVIDSGPGVPSEHRESVFEPFARLENSRSVPGTGLGLAISRELARAMGGELALGQSPEGAGSRFVLRLPRSMPLAGESATS